ncbi:hypothetical protein BHE96_07725 [Bacillus subtilis]|nr:hypothetical protein BHE96_07725 [Bacillus subtilis]
MERGDIMKQSKYFYCYSVNLHRKLRAAGASSICEALSTRNKRFWLYEKDETVQRILNEM